MRWEEVQVYDGTVIERRKQYRNQRCNEKKDFHLMEGVTLLKKFKQVSAKFNATREVNRRACFRKIFSETYRDAARHPEKYRFGECHPSDQSTLPANHTEALVSPDICPLSLMSRLDGCTWSAARFRMDHSEMLSIGTVEDRAGQTCLPDGEIENEFEAW